MPSNPISQAWDPHSFEPDDSPFAHMDRGPQECISPAAPPWRKFDDCVFFYETRTIQWQGVQVRVLYQHCLKLLGRQQGSLLYTLTLLPGETVKIYQYERYRRNTDKTDYFSVRAALAAEILNTHRKQTEERTGLSQNVAFGVTGGAGAVSIQGAPHSPVNVLFEVNTTLHNAAMTLDNVVSANVAHVVSEFAETVRRTSQALEADRSIVVSTFEEAEAGKVTERTLSNPNKCYAVTYFIRRVNEVYSLSAEATGITWRQFGAAGEYSPWQLVGELVGADKGAKEFIEKLLPQLPVGATQEFDFQITLPTDGAVFEPERAHCSSCDPEHRTEVLIELEAALNRARRVGAEADILELEVERRRRLLAADKLEPFASLSANAPT